MLAFNTTSYAEDISEFQIEGISIGESLLDYYSEKEIEELLITRSRPIEGMSKDFKELVLEDINGQSLEQYKYIFLGLKNDDKQYIIHGIGGLAPMQISECKPTQEEISKQILKIFWRSKKVFDDWNPDYSDDRGGKAHVILIEFENGYAALGCITSDEGYLTGDEGYLSVSSLVEEIF